MCLSHGHPFNRRKLTPASVFISLSNILKSFKFTLIYFANVEQMSSHVALLHLLRCCSLLRSAQNRRLSSSSSSASFPSWNRNCTCLSSENNRIRFSASLHAAFCSCACNFRCHLRCKRRYQEEEHPFKFEQPTFKNEQPTLKKKAPSGWWTRAKPCGSTRSGPIMFTQMKFKASNRHSKWVTDIQLRVSSGSTHWVLWARAKASMFQNKKHVCTNQIEDWNIRPIRL